MDNHPESETKPDELRQPPREGAGPETGDGEGLVLVSELLPEEIPIFPLAVRPFFPGLPVPMELSGDQLRLVEHAIESSNKTLGLVLVRDPDAGSSPENLHGMGVAAKIVQASPAEDHNAAHLVMNCIERFEIQEVRSIPAGIVARVEYRPAPELSVNPELKAYSMAIVATLKELVKLNPLQSEAIRMFLSRSTLDDPGRLADFSASLTTANGQELQRILETLDVRRRIDRTLVLLRKELDLTRLQNKITKQIEKKISSQQREFFLREELKAIKKELGLEKEGKDTEIEKFQRRLRRLRLNEEAEKAIEDEIQKLQLLEAASPEYALTRNYLDWLTVLPWGRFSKDSYNLKRARRVLNRDHYGLEDVKERILEFVAVGRMKGGITGSIICLVGPPGVGKTSIGRSIAAALNRKFYRFSLGGMRDEAEIKGHRRTYIGALPGKFIQAMKTAGTANPVIMLDEIDKVGASFHGDPASALLEVLDREQNESFRDHYLDVPFDLSHVLFVTTANQIDTIPGPLLDRMEVIRLSGYILEEKLEIARRYLIPKNLEHHGLKKGQLRIHKLALSRIIDHYAREAGVRSLENQLKKIMRRAAVNLSENGGRTHRGPEKGRGSLPGASPLRGGRDLRRGAGRRDGAGVDEPGRSDATGGGQRRRRQAQGFQADGSIG